jgi:hypothetical protein
MMRRALLLLLVSLAARGASPLSTTELLERTGASVQNFWEQFAAVNCVETVDQEKLGSGGKIVYRRESQFDYLAVLQISGTDFLVEESRIPILEAKPAKGLPLMITRGFSTFEFIFHPFFQSGFEYSAPEAVQVDGRELLLIRFQHVRGARSPSVIRLGRREYPLDWQGTAWIEPDGGAIVRISAGLMSSLEDVGLKAINADVRYSRVDFSADPRVHWLPSVATIEVETLQQRWRNVHTFTKYRHFSVEVKSEVDQPK